MRQNTHTEAQAAVGGEIPGGFFMARQAVIAGEGKKKKEQKTKKRNAN